MGVGHCRRLLCCSLASVMALAALNDDSRRCNPTRPLRHVAVVGGTHGNERMGVVIVDEIRRTKQMDFPFELTLMHGNEEAIKAHGTGAGRRYIDKDLNRCFLLEDLSRTGVSDAYEERRAKELNKLLGPKSSQDPRCDLILDLHSTTANTGILLCLHPQDTFALQLAAHLMTLDETVRVALWPDGGDVALLPTIARSGLTVEVGPCAHSTVDSHLLHRTKKLILDALAYVELHNGRCQRVSEGPAAEKEVPVHFTVRGLDYPRDETGERILGFIHPNLQGMPELREPLTATTAVFEMLDGSARTLGDLVQAHTLEEDVFPLFVNEAAYYEKNVALMLARRTMRTVSVWQPAGES